MSCFLTNVVETQGLFFFFVLKKILIKKNKKEKMRL